ncbi:solute carrier organic anion transporter family member 4A1-like isoform X4 [Strongylocentrotus purpuratus]|uniref:Kazal-like domain-containing protein n=1 Tax=Strongylocentrotus purpuratus TaxID=7668 RepID=A0A7M7HI68_STRPU|nr:solute carrier organic anion transporter family member 4A1-like isoform X4 [Strongylocentrotus purpuratus]|eukprot:XP_011661417.1 PREDICTED: solute carrier organic anion transporter family member 4A1-like isoform X2 [Strongylocentrotus purpuratus]
MSFYHDFSFIQMEGPTLNTSLASNISNGQTTSRPKEIVTSCGWCDWRPRWLQRFNSQRWLLAAISSAACMTLMIEDGFTNSAITSIERRFQLRSQDIGTILSIYEFTVIISIIPVTYFGGRGNKPRWISIGCFVVGVASLLFALPHFTTERYAYFSEKGNEQATCHLHEANSSSTSSVDSCRRNGKSISLLSRYIILFGAAKVIAGIGAPPQGSLGVVFIDESITTKQNGMYLRIAVIPGSVFGTFLGGWVMRRRKLKVPGLIKLAILGSTIETIAFLCVLMHCPQTQIAGVTTAYDSGNGSTLLNLTSSCNIACSCSADKFKPVCLEESGLSFFSPCHAGCSQDFENGTYGGCSCSPGMSFGIPSTVRHGKCSTPCNLQPAFIFMMNVVLVAIFMSKVPLMNIVLRCVAEHERAVALGMNSVVARTLGSIPGPILFGAIIDSTCLRWQETCGERGACWLYNNKSLSWKLTTLSLVCNVLTVLFYALALRFYEPASQGESSTDNRDVPETETCLNERNT